MFSYDEVRSFNELEMEIYNYIMQNKQNVVYMKIRDLADNAHVSTTTILRFCKKLGCEGYSEFKLKYKFWLQGEQKSQPDLDTSVLIEYLHRAEEEAYQAALERALDILLRAETIVFIGTGTSGVLGKYGARYFNNVGWFSLCIEDPFTPVNCGETDTTVAVALSVSGMTEQTITMASQLKGRGCTLISITNSSNCTLAQMSDCNISYYIPARRIDNLYDITSQIPVVYTLETLGRRMNGKKRKS